MPHLDKPSENMLTIAAAQAADIAGLRSLVATGAGGEQLLEQHLGQARYQPAFTRIARQAGEIVGSVLLRHSRWRLGAATLDVGLVEPLLFHEAAQQPTVVTAIAGDVFALLADYGVPVALLLREQPAFAEFGFAPFQQQIVTSGWQVGERAETLRTLTAADLDDCAALYTETYRDLPLSEVRTAADWQAWFTAQPTTYALEDTQRRLIAYASLHNQTVRELGAADAGAARMLVQVLPAGQLALPLAHRATRVAHWMGATTMVQLPATPAVVAGIVDLSGLLQQLAPTLFERLTGSRYAGWNGSLQIETANERVQLVIAANQVRVQAANSTADLRLRQVGLPALAQLCLGARAIADMRASGELACDDTALGLLDILFPAVG